MSAPIACHVTSVSTVAGPMLIQPRDLRQYCHVTKSALPLDLRQYRDTRTLSQCYDLCQYCDSGCT
eukprot:3782956-Rhodomonas_salina.1